MRRSKRPQGGRRNLLCATLCAAAFFAAAPSHARDIPARVVSMNVCTDQLALLIAAPGQVVSLSHFATDPQMSALASQARGYALNHGRAEEIYMLRPDLVLADVWSSPATVGMLRRLGVPVEQFPPGVSVEEIRRRISRMGEVLGREARAAEVLAGFDAALAAIKRPATAPRAAVYGAGGYGYGPATLEGQILSLAGFANVVSGPGLERGGRMSLERLVMEAPDLVIAGAEVNVPKGESRAQEILHHPALAALPRVQGLRDARWVCGAPAMLEAVADLAAVGRQIESEKIKGKQ
ncbi:ABC transporter substrate-binding protein [Phaeovulum sp.]|uniref:ABC transporter substrate-binding protein n=1 Tax=Phaeovulum sp. TaxID=2934796 RepID=UPI0039E2F505